MSESNSGPIYDTLPVFDHHHGRPAAWAGLRVEGMVQRPAVFTAEQLIELTRQALTDDFRCTEGWAVLNQEWEGVPLSALLEAAEPFPNARYAAVSASGFTVAITLDDADTMLLATRLNGTDLPEAHGGPCRLVSAGQACYASVKWVDSIRLTEQLPVETARDIAMARNAGVNSPNP